MEQLHILRLYRKGDEGETVKLIQEWLNLHEINLAIDGDFGPATELGVRRFQTYCDLHVDGIVGIKTFEKLVRPMTNALGPLGETTFKYSLHKKIIIYARRHLNQKAREVGGENRGPWVRLYMKGYEGDAWPWCAGFVIFIFSQVFGEQQLPFTDSFSVDNIVKSAICNKIFVKEVEVEKKNIVPGSLWVLRKEWGDWSHIGIVTEVKEDVFMAIEGNTNRRGEREGEKVAQKIRSYKNKDFIIW